MSDRLIWMHGSGPDSWLVLVLLGILTALPALGWIGPARPAGRNGGGDVAAHGLFSSLPLLASPVPIPLAPAASAPWPRGPTSAFPRLAPPGPSAG
jgi:hypothetical protein